MPKNAIATQSQLLNMWLCLWARLSPPVSGLEYAMILSATILATMSYGSGVTLQMPDLDRWNYPFNASPGDRTVGSTFSSYASGYDFDNRDGQLLLGWYGDRVAPSGLPASAYAINSCTVTLTIASDDIAYDPTLDDLASYEPDGPADIDPGRPVVLSGVGFRNGWDGWTFGETGPYGEAMTSGTRNCFAIDFDSRWSCAGYVKLTDTWIRA